MTRTEACETRKLAFRTIEEAYQHSDYLRQKFGTVSHAYWCQLCEQAHLTTTAQRPSPSQRPVRLTLGDRARQVYAVKK